MAEALPNRRILGFWSPLALTWAIMGVEVPVVSLAVARMPEPTQNLAALGAAVAIAWFSETLTVNLTAASLRLGEDRASYLAVRRYAFALLAIALVVNALLIFTPALAWTLTVVIGMDRALADLTVAAYGWLLLWPTAIGFRRFYQGQMIRHGDTRRIAYGTGVRLIALAGAAYVFSGSETLSGAEVGAIALLAGVLTEAAAARAMAGRALARTLARETGAAPPSFTEFWAFYWPLTVMMGLNLAVGALVTAGLAKSKDAVIALAAFPVAHGLNFVARAVSTSYQEAAIALLGEDERHAPALMRFALWLGGAITVLLALIAFTPAAGWLFQAVMDLPAALLDPANACFIALIPYPAVTLWFVWSRARLTHARATKPIATATIIETVALIVIMALCIGPLAMDGAVAAALAMVLSRVVANLWLERIAQSVFGRSPAP